MVNIEEVYGKFVKLSKELATQDLVDSPSEKRRLLGRQRPWEDTYKGKWEDRYQIHLIGMIEMYAVRFGDPKKRKEIVDFLEREFFPSTVNGKKDGIVYHLVYAHWETIKKTILEEPEGVVSG